MPWNGTGNFSRTNGVNTGTDVWQDDAATVETILSDRHDTHDQDIADGLNNALTKDGQSWPPSANLNLGNFKFTSCGEATEDNQYATRGQLLSETAPLVPYNPSPSSGNRAGAVEMSYGGTSDRPSSPANGDMRWNSDDNRYEHWRGGAWVAEVAQLNADAGEQMFLNQVSQKSYRDDAIQEPLFSQYRERRVGGVASGALLPGVAGDNLGQHEWWANNDAATPEQILFAAIRGELVDPTDGAEEGEAIILTRLAGSWGQRLKVGGYGIDALGDILKNGEPYHQSYSPVATTSGSSQQQTGLRASKKQVVVWLKDVSTTGTANIELKLGTSAGYPASGYDGNVVSASTAVGVSSWPADAIACNRSWGSTQNLSGTITLTRVGDTNSWIVQGSTGMTAGAGGFTQYQFNGYVDLPGELDRVQLETGNTFDLGEFGVHVIG